MLMRRKPERDFDWFTTPTGEPRGYITPHTLDELWFHTGTACNLSCPFCLEGSTPGDTRLDRITLADAQPFIDEAVALGVKQFSFTGGEPFIVTDFVNILRYASALNPCLVLTNGTDPVHKRLRQIETFVARDDPGAAERLIDRLINRGDALTDHPDRGRRLPELPESGLRELLVGNYRIVYRRTPKTVEVLTVFDGHRLLREDELSS